jgi:ribonuclease HI
MKMKVFEDDLSYVALQYTLGKTIRVYIDSSANFSKEDTIVNPEHGGTGWAIQGRSNALTGFGMHSLIAEPTTSSEIWELRGIIAFFETIKRIQPNLLHHEQKFHVHCDNQSLVKFLKTGKHATMKGISEQEILSLEEFLQVTDVSFLWVKGHKGDFFNTLADRLARRACMFLEEETPDFYYERQVFIQTVLNMKGHVPCFNIVSEPVPDEILRRKKDYKERHKTTLAEREEAVRTWADTVYVELNSVKSKDGGISHALVTSQFVENHEVKVIQDSSSATARELAAVAAALELCWSEECYDPHIPISFYGNLRKIQAFVNTINKGKEPDTTQTKSDPVLASEVERLKAIMAGRNARYLDLTMTERLGLSSKKTS